MFNRHLPNFAGISRFVQKMLNVLVCLLLSTALAEPFVLRSKNEVKKFRKDLVKTTQGRFKRNDLRSSAWVDSGKYQGDILLDDEQIQSMVEQFAKGKDAFSWPGDRWPDQVVIYEFAVDHFTSAEESWILKHMRFIAEHTCIKFRTRNGERNYVVISGYDDGCYANVGYSDGRGIHTLNLKPGTIGWGCLQNNVIIHEWLHIIGFFHMHSSYKRDEYVRINWDNVLEGSEIAFDIYDSTLVTELDLTYKYDSCMHYGPYDFTKNGLPTLTALRPLNGVVMGQVQYITWDDFYRVDRLYRCKPWKKREDYQIDHINLPSAEEFNKLKF